MHGSKALLAGAILVGLVGAAPAQEVERDAFTGIWHTGKGVTEIRPCGAALCGYIYAILSVPDPSKPLRDNRNDKAELRNRPLCGLQIMGGLKKVAPDAWGDGWVYDPENGKQYSAEITLKGKTLEVRGYIGAKFMGRTVEWSRMAAPPQKCSPPKAS